MLDVDNATMAEAECDVLRIDHSGGRWYSNDSPELVASRLARAIENVYSADDGRPPYAEIFLIGHSAGGLLVRKAFIFASARTNFDAYQDNDNPQDCPFTWAGSVKRIVTLAALDRGFTLGSNQVAAGDSILKALLRTIAFRAGQILGVGKFIRALRRGTPFIVNTRVQWIRLMQSSTLPPLFQLIGDRDDLIGERDNVDILLKSPSYVYLPVTGATHTSVVKLDEGSDAAAMFAKALKYDTSSYDGTLRAPGRDPTINGVVYVMHGIRDVGAQWADDFAREIEQRSGGRLRAQHRSYGYFSALEFIFRTRRMRNVRWFMDVYTEQIAKFPNADHYYFGHSNGTYVIGNAMLRYVTCRMKRIALAGSVLPVDYDWTPFMPKRLEAVRNEVGSADIVVALLPRLWEDAKTLIRFFNLPCPPFFDLGAAGVSGFLNGCTYQNRFIEPCWPQDRPPSLFWRLANGHGAALSGRNRSSLADFIATGSNTPYKSDQLPIIERIVKFGWVIPLVLCAILVITTVFLGPILGPVIQSLAAENPIAFWGIVVLAGFALVLFALSF